MASSTHAAPSGQKKATVGFDDIPRISDPRAPLLGDEVRPKKGKLKGLKDGIAKWMRSKKPPKKDPISTPSEIEEIWKGATHHTDPTKEFHLDPDIVIDEAGLKRVEAQHSHDEHQRDLHNITNMPSHETRDNTGLTRDLLSSPVIQQQAAQAIIGLNTAKQDLSAQKRKIPVPFIIDEQTRDLLIRHYTEHDFISSGGVEYPHVYQMCANKADKDRLSLRFRGHHIIEIGGRSTDHHLGISLTGFHICNPLMENRDNGRRATDSHRATNLSPSGIPIRPGSKVSRCFQDTRFCKIKGDIMLAFHATYDMTVEELAEAMISHGAHTLVCTEWHADIISATSGELLGDRIRWYTQTKSSDSAISTYHQLGRKIHINPRNNEYGFRGEDVIKFVHDRETEIPYTHLLNTYMQKHFTTKTVNVIDRDDTKHMFEISRRMYNDGSMMEITMKYCGVVEEFQPNILALSPVIPEGYTMVTVSLGKAKDNNHQMKKFLVKSDHFNYIVSFLKRGGKLDENEAPREALRYMISAQQRVFFSYGTIKAQAQMDPTDIHLFIAAIAAWANIEEVTKLDKNFKTFMKAGKSNNKKKLGFTLNPYKIFQANRKFRRGHFKVSKYGSNIVTYVMSFLPRNYNDFLTSMHENTVTVMSRKDIIEMKADDPTLRINTVPTIFENRLKVPKRPLAPAAKADRDELLTPTSYAITALSYNDYRNLPINDWRKKDADCVNLVEKFVKSSLCHQICLPTGSDLDKAEHKLDVDASLRDLHKIHLPSKDPQHYGLRTRWDLFAICEMSTLLGISSVKKGVVLLEVYAATAKNNFELPVHYTKEFQIRNVVENKEEIGKHYVAVIDGVIMCPMTQTIAGQRAILYKEAEYHFSYKKLEAILQLTPENILHNYHTTLVEGAPGCGKSTTIRNSADLKRGDLILTQTNDAKKTMIDMLKKDGVEHGAATLGVRTVTSYLLNPDGLVHERILFDEAPSMSPGDIAAAARLAKAREIHCLGDRRQVRYDSFVPTFPLCFGEIPEWYFDKKVTAPISGGITPWAAHVIQNSYSFDVKTIRTLEQCPRPVDIISTLPSADKANKSGLKIMTYLQCDKNTAIGVGYSNVATVAETQGFRAAMLALYATLQDKSNTITKADTPHSIVAVTRHTEGLIVCTTKQLPIIDMLSALDNEAGRKLVRAHIVGLAEFKAQIDKIAQSLHRQEVLDDDNESCAYATFGELLLRMKRMGLYFEEVPATGKEVRNKFDPDGSIGDFDKVSGAKFQKLFDVYKDKLKWDLVMQPVEIGSQLPVVMHVRHDGNHWAPGRGAGVNYEIAHTMDPRGQGHECIPTTKSGMYNRSAQELDKRSTEDRALATYTQLLKYIPDSMPVVELSAKPGVLASKISKSRRDITYFGYAYHGVGATTTTDVTPPSVRLDPYHGDVMELIPRINKLPTAGPFVIVSDIVVEGSITEVWQSQKESLENTIAVINATKCNFALVRVLICDELVEYLAKLNKTISFIKVSTDNPANCEAYIRIADGDLDCSAFRLAAANFNECLRGNVATMVSGSGWIRNFVGNMDGWQDFELQVPLSRGKGGEAMRVADEHQCYTAALATEILLQRLNELASIMGIEDLQFLADRCKSVVRAIRDVMVPYDQIEQVVIGRIKHAVGYNGNIDCRLNITAISPYILSRNEVAINETVYERRNVWDTLTTTKELNRIHHIMGRPHGPYSNSAGAINYRKTMKRWRKFDYDPVDSRKRPIALPQGVAIVTSRVSVEMINHVITTCTAMICIGFQLRHTREDMTFDARHPKNDIYYYSKGTKYWRKGRYAPDNNTLPFRADGSLPTKRGKAIERCRKVGKLFTKKTKELPVFGTMWVTSKPEAKETGPTISEFDDVNGVSTTEIDKMVQELIESALAAKDEPDAAKDTPDKPNVGKDVSDQSSDVENLCGDNLLIGMARRVEEETMDTTSLGSSESSESLPVSMASVSSGQSTPSESLGSLPEQMMYSPPGLSIPGLVECHVKHSEIPERLDEGTRPPSVHVAESQQVRSPETQNRQKKSETNSPPVYDPKYMVKQLEVTEEGKTEVESVEMKSILDMVSLRSLEGKLPLKTGTMLSVPHKRRDQVIYNSTISHSEQKQVEACSSATPAKAVSQNLNLHKSDSTSPDSSITSEGAMETRGAKAKRKRRMTKASQNRVKTYQHQRGPSVNTGAPKYSLHKFSTHYEYAQEALLNGEALVRRGSQFVKVRCEVTGQNTCAILMLHQLLVTMGNDVSPVVDASYYREKFPGLLDNNIADAIELISLGMAMVGYEVDELNPTDPAAGDAVIGVSYAYPIHPATIGHWRFCVIVRESTPQELVKKIIIRSNATGRGAFTGTAKLAPATHDGPSVYYTGIPASNPTLTGIKEELFEALVTKLGIPPTDMYEEPILSVPKAEVFRGTAGVGPTSIDSIVIACQTAVEMSGSMKGSGLNDNKFDSYLLTEADIQVPTTMEFQMDPTKQGPPKPVSHMCSKIRSSIAATPYVTQQIMLAAFLDRNATAKKNTVDIPPIGEARKMINQFIHRAIPPGLRKAFLSIRDTMPPIGLSKEHLSEWCANLTEAKAKRVLTKYGLAEEIDCSKYQTSMKKEVKSSVDQSKMHSRTKYQVINQSAPIVTAVFSHVFHQVLQRLRPFLDPKITMNIGLTVDQLGARMSEALRSAGVYWEDTDDTLRTPFGVSSVSATDMDYASYDKQQGIEALELEKEFLTMLGVEQHLLDAWYDAHVNTTCTARREGLRFRVFFQRKSGDASTAFGNTLINMLVFFYLLGDRPYYAFAAIGDDNVVLHPPGLPPICPRQRREFAEVANFEAKVNEPIVPYFAGNFMCAVEGNVIMVPDPMKILDKLGRQYSTKEQLSELYIARHDQITRIMAPEVHWQVLKGMASTYGHEYPSMVTTALCMAVSKCSRFTKLWTKMVV